MDALGIDDPGSRFEARYLRMTSPRVLLRLCHRSMLDRQDARALAIVEEIARRIGAEATSGSVPALRSAFAPFGWWAETDGVPSRVILLDERGDRVLAHDFGTAAGPSDALPEAAAKLRLRLQDAVECATKGGFSLADERCHAQRWKAGVVPVRREGRVVAVLCVLFAAGRPADAVARASPSS